MDDLNPRKRPRPVVSCLRCREKKLKCNRLSPCNNCTKAQIANTCTYKRDGASTLAKSVPGTSPSKTSSAPLSAIEDLQRRMTRLEDMMGLSTTSSSSRSETVARDTHVQPSPPTPLLGTLVVKGGRSVYHGQNDRSTLFDQFVEVKDYLSIMSTDTQIQASAKQIKSLQEKSSQKVASPDSPASDFSLSLLKLHDHLPPKEYCDQLVATYFGHFERTIRVLHRPTFMRQYEEIWINPIEESWKSSSIIPQLTAVLTMGYQMDSLYPISNDNETYRAYLDGPAMDLVQSWLDELGRKQRTMLATLQVDILLLLACRIRHIIPDKSWTKTGALVRSAMAMGLHVDASSVKKMTPYQMEMRRRLWVTILEMDVQTSMATGMPLVVPELGHENLVPVNIDDADFDEDSIALPAPRSLETYTDSLYQVYLAQSLPARLRALSLVQLACPDIEDAVKAGRKVEEHLLRKPAVLNLYNSAGAAPTDSGSLLHRVVVDLYLRRALLYLYKPLLLHKPQNHVLYAEVRRQSLGSSLVILSYQDLYSSELLGVTTSTPPPHQDLFYRCCKTDMLWAALGVCQHMKLCALSPVQHARAHAHAAVPAAIEAGPSKASLIQTVQKAIDHLIHHIGRKGSDLKDIVFLSLALASIQLPDSCPNRASVLSSTAKASLSACRERLMQTMTTTDSTTRPFRAPLSESTLASVGSVPTLTSTSTSTPFPAELPENVQQWFGDLPDLSADFDVQFGASEGDAFAFGEHGNWNWDRVWE
ncbi:hypothetical protein K504DRAFT_387208 [Pleomassaria siparia CBS 279.74]|uniref:Zn(2)-C6 fungal-type domain-containing protein n=1 Tax=Pleomassaria siparia CBS 279.74 TaxID=1314801 RepID=A0A6G1JYQ5_9PLEO|nr:hypothetical protein K504DRAFT_387208 [Pleomassaria siparia CBS 279.74]